MEREELYRVGIFLTLLGLFAAWELITPRRSQVGRKSVRWFANLSLVTLNTLLVPVIVPITALAASALAAEHGWGALNRWAGPYAAAVVLSVVILDFAIYLQHIMFHAVPILWRLHRVHHSDVDLDVTSGTRFHLIEIAISTCIKIAVILLLGPPIMSVLLFEILLNATAMFNHANIRIPLRLDSLLRRFVVTPDMHRIHHSVIPEEMNTNFGFNLPWWDYLCGTYRAQPVKGHTGMTIGIDRFRSVHDQYPHRLLIQPFRKGTRELDNDPNPDPPT
jgi:sterol desaturase/sphingolipid hydroxylase (fatty acid hydroxylase superfamily)